MIALTRLMTDFFKGEDAGDKRPLVESMSSSSKQWWERHMRPELTSPVVAWLASQDCDVNGRILDPAAGVTLHQYIATTRGFYDPALTPESVHANRASIFDREGAQVFDRSPDLSAWRCGVIDDHTAHADNGDESVKNQA